MLAVTFSHKGFDETRRLGLQIETEQTVRHASPPGETGMLVVDSVVPGGPAHKHLEPGDVLVRMNGEVITQFLKTESLLDDSIDQKVELQIERGGTTLTFDLVVQNLHSITPDYFLEVSGAVIQPLSYQQPILAMGVFMVYVFDSLSIGSLQNGCGSEGFTRARNFRFHSGLVYVTEPGYMLFRAGVPRHAIIKKFAGEEICRLEDLILVLSKLSRGARIPLEFVRYTDRHRRKSVLVTVDGHEWYAPPQIYTRDDGSGLWTAKPALPPDCPLLSSATKHVGQGLANHILSSDASEASPMEHVHHTISQESSDGVTSIETSDEYVAEGQASRDESDFGTKKLQEEENSSADGLVIADGSLDEPTEVGLEDSKTLEDAVLRDYQGAAAAAANASVAERVIEPTLVMLE
ncbi:unnamed protein product, partial [Ilex paraguariensis]